PGGDGPASGNGMRGPPGEFLPESALGGVYLAPGERQPLQRETAPAAGEGTSEGRRQDVHLLMRCRDAAPRVPRVCLYHFPHDAESIMPSDFFLRSLFSSFLRRPLNAFAQARRSGRRSRKRQERCPARRFLVERLEDRLTPSGGGLLGTFELDGNAVTGNVTAGEGAPPPIPQGA